MKIKVKMTLGELISNIEQHTERSDVARANFIQRRNLENWVYQHRGMVRRLLSHPRGLMIAELSEDDRGVRPSLSKAVQRGRDYGALIRRPTFWSIQLTPLGEEVYFKMLEEEDEENKSLGA